jgi:NAD(P)-dependent dehydrogenase (short-subunit alcohol dehydrogenase family)
MSRFPIRSAWVLGSTSAVAIAICQALARQGCRRFHLIARNPIANQALAGEQGHRDRALHVGQHFGDGLVGPREYDWLGPLCFYCAGHAGRLQAFFGGYGARPDAAARLALLRLMLLHRYSNLKAQLALPGWQQAPSFEALAALLWP